MFELMTSPGYLRFVGDRGVNSVADAERYIAEYFLKSTKINGFGFFVARNNSSESMGVVGFLKKDYLRNPDIGFAFLPQYSGQGLAYEVCQTVLPHAQSNWIAGDIDAITDQENTASHRLLSKLHFKYLRDILHQDQVLKLYRRSRID